MERDYLFISAYRKTRRRWRTRLCEEGFAVEQLAGCEAALRPEAENAEAGDFPVSEELGRRIFPEFGAEGVEEMANAIRSFYQAL